MFSWEIKNFLEQRNYHLGGNDLLFILDVKQHPQINHIKFNPYDNSYEMWDKEGNYFHFTAIPYKEVIKKEDEERQL